MKNVFPLRFILMIGLLTLALSFTVDAKPNDVNSTCSQYQESVRAEYLITSTDNNGAKSQTRLILWRHGNEVAHQYPATGITEVWQRVAGNRIKPIRFFDQHKRAIEYQPGESVHGKNETNWSYRYQLIADESIGAMKKVSSSGEGCEAVNTFNHSSPNGNSELTWLSEQKLIANFTLVLPNGVETWTLVNKTNDPVATQDFFATRHDYLATDYADIGDDHTDPFLTQMVTQGFVEHGASGFYDDKGNAIGHHDH